MSACIFWSGSMGANGYGRARRDGRRIEAHRLCWERENGPVPEGMDLDHLCGARSCVNPDHLEPVTHRENLLRSPNTLAGINARKTACPRGHEYAGDNLRFNNRGHRVCRACDIARKRLHKEDAA